MSRASHPATVVALVVSGALIGTCVAAAITSLGGGSSLSSLGLPDPGVLTTYGLPVIRALTETAAMVTIGALLVTGVLSPTRLARTAGRERIEVDPRAAGVASLSAALWAAGALLLVPLTVADSLGQPVAGLLSLTRLLVLVPHLATAQAWAQTALVAVAVGLWCRFARSWPSTLALAALAILGLLPVAATGHSSAGGAHDIATDSLMVHVVAASVWIGGLIALLRLAVVAGTSGRRLPLAARRFSTMALCCWLAMAVSGILNAAVRVRAADVFDTFYGRLVLAKAVCLLLLGGLGYLQRRRGLVGLAAGRAGSLVRLGGYEVLIMLGTLGLAVALGHSAPPSAGRVVVSRLAVSIGYDLPDPPSALALATGWRIDLIIGGGALVAALAYLHATRRPRHTARPWSRWRTLCWLAGCTLVVLATSSGLGRYARAMFSAALVQHTLLAVPAALLLVLGAPVALGRRILPIAAPDDPPAGGDMLAALVDCRPVRLLAQPVLALLLFAVPPYLVYFTGLFDQLLNSHPEQVGYSAVTLAVGMVYFHSLPRHSRAGSILFLAAGAGAYTLLAAMILTSPRLLGAAFYTNLPLAWQPAPNYWSDQRAGALLTLLISDITILITLAVLVRSGKPGSGGL